MGPQDLTPDDRLRVVATLRRRYATAAYPQILDVTLGAAVLEAAGRTDPGRPWAARFHVRKKLARPGKDAVLPDRVEVRLRRVGGYETVKLPTDIIDVGRVRPTGAALVMPRAGVGPVTPATGGLLLTWVVPSPIGDIPYQGLLTVGHACDPPSAFGAGGGPVAVRSGGQVSGGRLFARSMARLDASVLTVAGDRLAIDHLRPVRGLSLLMEDMGQPGASLHAGGRAPFTVTAPPATQDLGEPWGVQRNVVWVESLDDNAFEPGTSGSVWVIETPGGDQAAMIQLGAMDNGFRLGVGQVIDETSLPWAFGRVAARTGVEAQSIAVAGGF